MKLTTMTQVTIDGVMQGNGAASDDRRNGFERGGWARGKGNDETRAFMSRVDSKGVTIQVYRPAGHPQYAPTV